MIAAAQVARRKKRAKTGPDRMPLGHGDNALAPANEPLGHGEDALAPVTQTPASNEAGRRDACPTAARAWSPDANDHLVYQWVRFGGKTQELAAQLLGISQPTVSRMIERYERWQAHAQEREGGRLDHAERLRAQRWLTYERNELILASSLRIAAEMEGLTELTKSVVSRPMSQFTKETEIRSESATIDRHGIASRFLRLAFRINMEQLKLVSQDPPPLPEPLSVEELEKQAADAAAILAEFAAVERAAAEAAAAERQRVAEEQRAASEMADLERSARKEAEEAAAGDTGRRDARPTAQAETSEEAVAEAARVADDPEAGDEAMGASEAIIHPVNEMNTGRAKQLDVNDVAACCCAAEAEERDFSPVMHAAPEGGCISHIEANSDSLAWASG